VMVTVWAYLNVPPAGDIAGVATITWPEDEPEEEPPWLQPLVHAISRTAISAQRGTADRNLAQMRPSDIGS